MVPTKCTLMPLPNRGDNCPESSPPSGCHLAAKSTTMPNTTATVKYPPIRKQDWRTFVFLWYRLVAFTNCGLHVIPEAVMCPQDGDENFISSCQKTPWHQDREVKFHERKVLKTIFSIGLFKYFVTGQVTIFRCSSYKWRVDSGKKTEASHTCDASSKA